MDDSFSVVFKHHTEENYDYYMLCGSGNCHCFHHRGNAGLNPGHSRTTRHANTQQSKNTQDKNTQQSKNTTDSHFQFPVSWMQSTTCHILKDTFFQAVYRARGVVRMSCYFVNVWCCKLFIWVLSVVDMMCQKSEFLKVTKWHVRIY